MSMSQAAAARMDRLAGDGNSVAGIDLAALFRVILNQIQDAGTGVSAEDLGKSVEETVTNGARVEHL
jgi:hypothetical protein